MCVDTSGVITRITARLELVFLLELQLHLLKSTRRGNELASFIAVLGFRSTAAERSAELDSLSTRPAPAGHHVLST